MKIVRGILVEVRKNTQTWEYSASNKSSKDKMLVIEHPVHAGVHARVEREMGAVEVVEAVPEPRPEG